MSSLHSLAFFLFFLSFSFFFSVSLTGSAVGKAGAPTPAQYYTLYIYRHLPYMNINYLIYMYSAVHLLVCFNFKSDYMLYLSYTHTH